MNLKPVYNPILDDYALPLGGDHGVAHWARVLENGLRLAEETGAIVSFPVAGENRLQIEGRWQTVLHGVE